MPIYYLNNNGTQNEFYTDAGSFRNALRISGCMDVVKLEYYIGYDEITGRKKSIYKGKASPGMEIFLDWLTPDILMRMLMDKHLYAEEFKILINRDLVVECRAPHDMIVRYSDEAFTKDVFSACDVPKGVQAAMLSEPGSMFNCVQRTGEYKFYGYFKSINIWLNKHKFEKLKHQGFFQSNMN